MCIDYNTSFDNFERYMCIYMTGWCLETHYMHCYNARDTAVHDSSACTLTVTTPATSSSSSSSCWPTRGSRHCSGNRAVAGSSRPASTAPLWWTTTFRHWQYNRPMFLHCRAREMEQSYAHAILLNNSDIVTWFWIETLARGRGLEAERPGRGAGTMFITCIRC